MKIIEGDIWPEIDNPETNLFLFTANSMLNSRKELIMGAGIAKEVKERYPEIPGRLAIRIRLKGGSGCEYGVVTTQLFHLSKEDREPDAYEEYEAKHQTLSMFEEEVIQPRLHSFTGNPYIRIGAFQTKIDYQDRSSVKLLRFSVAELMKRVHIFKRVVMNYPCIGNGGLSENVVYPIIRELPDNVYIYKNNQLRQFGAEPA